MKREPLLLELNGKLELRLIDSLKKRELPRSLLKLRPEDKLKRQDWLKLELPGKPKERLIG